MNSEKNLEDVIMMTENSIENVVVKEKLGKLKENPEKWGLGTLTGNVSVHGAV